MRGSWRLFVAAAVFAVVGGGLSGCGGASRHLTSGTPAAETGGSINVAIVNNPQMTDLASLTPQLFTAKTGIRVNYTVLDEDTLRQVATQDLSSGGQGFDVVMISSYDAPQQGRDGTLVDLTPMAKSDPSYEFDDLIGSVRDALSFEGKMYASPFYGESSFLMYRKDVLQKAGITMPEHPTWMQVADIARRVNSPGMAGICLRGLPGWGELGAPLTTVVNTFGGTWWSAKPDGSVGSAQVDQPGFARALRFYVNLIKQAGEKDAAGSSYNQCLSQYLDGRVAMWYDATVGAGLLEAHGSKVRGRNGYVFAPVEQTGYAGWLYSWAFAIPKASSQRALAWKYISWATGPKYIKQAGTIVPGGWAAIPPGTRKSTYEIPQYKQAATAFAPLTLESIAAAPINNPGTTKRPGLPGVAYVGIPQFQDVGNQCTVQFSRAIAGATSITAALRNCQAIASQVGG